MTQIQHIEAQFEKVTNGPAIVQFWKKAIADGRIVEVIHALKIEIRDNRPWVAALLGETITLMVEGFNPLSETDIKLAELNELWKLPKGHEKFTAIRKLINDLHILFNMAELSK